MFLHDPSNRRTASIDKYYRLNVTATNMDMNSFLSEEIGSCYTVHLMHTIQVNDTIEQLGFISIGTALTYTKLIQIFCSAKTSTYSTIEGFLGTTRTSGGTIINPVNLNSLKNRPSNIIAYDNSSNNLVLVTDTTKEIMHVELCNGHRGAVRDYDGSVILGPSNTFSLRCKGTAGDIITTTIHFVEDDMGD